MDRRVLLAVAGAALLLVTSLAVVGRFQRVAERAGVPEQAPSVQAPTQNRGAAAGPEDDGPTPEVPTGDEEPGAADRAAPVSPEHRRALAELRADLAALQRPVDVLVDPEASVADQDAAIAGAIRDRAQRLGRMTARAEALVAADDPARSARALLLLRDGHEAMADFFDGVPAPAYLDPAGRAAFEEALGARSDEQLAAADAVTARADGHLAGLPSDHPLRAR